MMTLAFPNLTGLRLYAILSVAVFHLSYIDVTAWIRDACVVRGLG